MRNYRKAEMLKYRHTFLCGIVFLMPLISGFLQIIGIALPFAASIVCAGNVELEEANYSVCS